ncbi:hypothetical protein C6499_07660 [Candidatus Poribacteria bacterium]|nr:MAG: hypothetical protein C6499_07660 [Candidatus Poribacteria bacterium]
MPSDYKAITEHNKVQLGEDTSSRRDQVSMYSDPTHFVYELLQNADDYKATEVLFKLSKGDLVIEHNGEPFKEENVKAITYFSKSTSREDLVKTGHFGIGFKSVFAFTATPIIISGAEHFKIYDLYCIEEYPYPEGFSHSHTCIILPFNHKSERPNFVEEHKFRSKEEAYRQISECLLELDMNTLLFTRNIRKIRWEVGDQSECYSREDDEMDSNTRLTTIKDGKREKGYLVFSKIPTWKNEEHKPVEIAFALDKLDKQYQLSPIDGEFLHVLFPTTEKTGLRFILNGPYRTNPARETISKKDDFNLHLMKVTCELMKELLLKLRDRKYLIVQFLSILPNKENTLDKKDKLWDFYNLLRNTIVHEFRNKKLTPTKGGGHAAASGLYRVNTELSDLISDEDLAMLLGQDCSLPLIVDELSQRRDEKGRFVQDPNAQFIDNFLDALHIPNWNMDQLINMFFVQPEMIKKWLATKSVEDHQVLYALIYDFLGLRWTGTYWYSSDNSLKNRLSDFPIVRCSDGTYKVGGKCFFPSDDMEADDRFPYVLKDVYSSGQNDGQKSKAQDFLKAIKVRPIDEVVEIEAILNLRYVKGTIKLRETYHKQDLERFIALVEKEPDKAILFKDYYIFELDKGGSGTWWFPRKAFLDTPYYNTGLRTYHALLAGVDENSEIRRLAISPKYEKFGIDLEKLVEFAKAIGVQTELDAIEQEIPSEHPEYSYLVTDALGKRVTYTSRNKDYNIPQFDTFLFSVPRLTQIDKMIALDAAKLIWQTMCSQPDNCLEARFRKSASYPERVGASSLVHILRQGLWVPQKDGDTISFVCPCDASREHLPEKDGFPWPKGYPHDAGEAWLKAVEFGKTAKEQREEYIQRDQQAKILGFDSSEEAEKYAELHRLLKSEKVPVDDVISQYSSQNNNTKPDFPTSTVRNPELRKKRVLEQVKNASEKAYEKRERTERDKREIDQRTSLIEWYTNESGEMICQICKEEMPFKKTDGEYYFKAVEALTTRFKDDELPENHFPKEYEAQYLALCPGCEARYDYFARTAAGSIKLMEELRDQLMNSDDLEVPVCLGELETSIRFVETHLHDLKEVLYYYENSQDSEESTD